MAREKNLDFQLVQELDKKMRFLWERKCYQLNESEEKKWISRIPESKPERYNPFDFYFSGERQKDSLHLIFASLDPYDPEQIKEFCFNWGMLGLFEHELPAQYYLPMDIQQHVWESKKDNQQETILFAPRLGGAHNAELVGLSEVAAKFNISDEKVSRLQTLQSTEILANVETSESIEDISYEIQNFNNLISLREALKNKDYERIKKIIGIRDDLTGEEILDHGQEVISAFLVTVLERNVTPLIKWTGQTPVLRLRCETLIESIYLMLLNDVLNDVNVKQCPHCHEWFSYGKRVPNYCSTKCQDNAKSARYKVEAKKKLEQTKAGL